jgi:hypothetical protein
MFCERWGPSIGDVAAFRDDLPDGKSVRPGDVSTAGGGGSFAPHLKAPNIIESPDGSLSWAYELSFWRNPTILITVLKVMFLSLGIVTLLAFVLALADGVEDAAMFALTMFGIGAAVLTALTLAAYVIIGLLYGGRYHVLFKMDRRGVHHIQLKKQYDRAAALGLLTALAGLAGGSLTAVGAGMLAASRQSMYTAFKDVTSVKIRERRNVIYLGEALAQNQVYAEAEDLPRVKAYILEHIRKDVRVR